MKDFKDLEKVIGITLEDQDLLNQAFVHRSYLNECEPGCESNERMEFLGDAVLELISSEYLYKNYPEQTEGDMTNFRSALVQGKNLALVARDLDLGRYLHLSHGEENSGGRDKNYLLANTVEALIGAIYLDQGFEAAKKFIDTFIITRLDDIIENKLYLDAKTRFQEIVQEKMDVTPTYEVLKESGPDHNKEFEAGAYISEELIATGTGPSKQSAEEHAAQASLVAKGWTK